MAEDIKKINDEINKLRAELGKNPLKPFNDSDLEKAKALLSGIRAEVREMSSDLDYVAKSFKDSVNELSNQKSYLSDAKKSLNGIANIAQKITDYRRGESSLNEKQLKDLQNQARIRFEELDRIKKVGNLSKENQRELIRTLAEQDTFNESVEKTIEYQKQVNKEIGLLGTGIGGVSKALSKLGFGDFSQPLNDAIEKTKNARLQMKLNKDTIAANTKEYDYLSKKLQPLTIEEVKRKRELLEQNKNLENQNQELSTQTSKYKNIGKALTDQLTKTNLIDFALGQMVSALIKSDKETGELAKAFGTSYNEAANLRNELNTVANLSGDVNITTSALQKSLIAVNKEFGTATMFSGELLKDFTQLTEVAGYTNEAAARLSKISVATGTDLSKNTAQILGTAKAFNATNKLALNEKEIVEDVAKASKATTLSLGMQPGALTKAVAQAKALGANLEKVEAISQSLLNFESSISSELEAELLTGKDLNLERARMYALNNDIAGVAKEIAGQIGKASDFTNMNVIQQEALAKSVGMTREDLAASLIEREALAAIGDGDKTAVEAYNRLKKEGLSDEQIRVRLGDDALANQLKSQSVQERFNASVEKLKEIFVSLAGPVLQIVSPFMDLVTNILPLINVILTPVTWTIGKIGEGLGIMVGFLTQAQDVAMVLVGTFGAILAFQNRSNIAKAAGIALDKTRALFAKREAGQSLGQAALEAIKSVVKTPIVGPLLAAAAAAGVYALGKSYLTKGDDVVSPGYGKRTLLMGKDAIALNDKDTVIAGTDLGGKKSKSSSLKPSSPTPLVIDYNKIATSIAKEINNRPVQVSVEMDGEKVAKGVGNNSTKFSNSMSTNTFQVQ